MKFISETSHIKKLVLFLLIATGVARADNVSNIVIDCGSTNVGTAYVTTSPAMTPLALSNPGSYRKHLLVSNLYAGRVCLNTETTSTTLAPSAGNGHEYCLPGSSIVAWDDIPFIQNLYVRSGSGSTCTSGTIDITVW